MKTETNLYKANQKSKTLQCIKDYIYIYIVSKVGGRDYEQLIASFHLGSPPYSPFGAVIHQGFLRK